MPANLEVEQGKNENQITLSNIYPKEPKANNSEKIRLTGNGSILNGNKVVSKKLDQKGLITIVTEKKGKDDNKKATLRYTYSISSNEFSIVKEVQFEDSKDWILRSKFEYKRV
jgi:hypothetical protein